jgi:hypothetical protein
MALMQARLLWQYDSSWGKASGPSESKDLHEEERDRYTEYSGNEIADDIRQAEHIVENEDNDVLDDIIRYIGNGEAYIASPG